MGLREPCWNKKKYHLYKSEKNNDRCLESKKPSFDKVDICLCGVKTNLGQQNNITRFPAIGSIPFIQKFTFSL